MEFKCCVNYSPDENILFNFISIVDLKKWQKYSESEPLFHVVMADSPAPSSLIWIVSMHAKIGKKNLVQEKVRAFQYPRTAQKTYVQRERVSEGIKEITSALVPYST